MMKEAIALPQDRGSATEAATEEPSPLAIEVAGLARSFGETTVLDGVTLCVEPGGVFGLLGPNGAGKTTTVRILTGVLRPDRAVRLRVLGHDLPDQIARVRPHIGVQTDTALYDRLTGLDNLTFFGRLYGMAPADAASAAHALLDRFGLGDRQADRVGTYSKGMKQKTLIARALIADPRAGLPRRADGGAGPGGGARADDLHPRPVHRAGPHVLHHLPPPRGDGVGLHQGGGALRRPDRGTGRTRRGRANAGARGACPGHGGAPDGPRRSRGIAALDGVRGVTPVDGGAIVELTARQAVPAVVRAIAGMPGDLLGVAEEPPTLEEAYLRLVRQQETRP